MEPRVRVELTSDVSNPLAHYKGAASAVLRPGREFRAAGCAPATYGPKPYMLLLHYALMRKPPRGTLTETTGKQGLHRPYLVASQRHVGERQAPMKMRKGGCDFNRARLFAMYGKQTTLGEVVIMTGQWKMKGDTS